MEDEQASRRDCEKLAKTPGNLHMFEAGFSKSRMLLLKEIVPASGIPQDINWLTGEGMKRKKASDMNTRSLNTLIYIGYSIGMMTAEEQIGLTHVVGVS